MNKFATEGRLGGDIFGREPLQDSSLEQDRRELNYLLGKNVGSPEDFNPMHRPIKIGSYLPSNTDDNQEEESEKFYYSEDVLALQRQSEIVEIHNPNRVVPQSFPEQFLRKEMEETMEIRGEGVPVTVRKELEVSEKNQVMQPPMNSEASSKLIQDKTIA